MNGWIGMARGVRREPLPEAAFAGAPGEQAAQPPIGQAAQPAVEQTAQPAAEQMAQPATERAAEGNGGVEQRIRQIRQELAALDALGYLPEGFDLALAMADMRFAQLTAQLPPLAAARVYDAERRAEDAERIAMQNLTARMAARQALPTPARAGTGISPQRDYQSMDAATFRKLEEEMRARARRGERVSL